MVSITTRREFGNMASQVIPFSFTTTRSTRLLLKRNEQEASRMSHSNFCCRLRDHTTTLFSRSSNRCVKNIGRTSLRYQESILGLWCLHRCYYPCTTRRSLLGTLDQFQFLLQDPNMGLQHLKFSDTSPFWHFVVCTGGSKSNRPRNWNESVT